MYDFHYKFPQFPGQLQGPLAFHVKVFLLANYLDIDDLKSMAATKFSEQLKEKFDVGDLADAAILAYETKSIARPICVPLVSLLVKHDHLLDGSSKCPQMEKAVKDAPDLALDILRATKVILQTVDESKDSRQEYRCPSCTNTFRCNTMPNTNSLHYCNGGCDARFAGTTWNASYRVASPKAAAIVKVESGGWWRD